MATNAQCPYCKNAIDVTHAPTTCPRCGVSLDGVDFGSTNRWRRETTPDDVAEIRSYLVANIISTLFGCGLFGIIGIVYSSLTIGAKKDLDLGRAEKYSTAARSLMIWSYAIVAVFWIVYLVGHYFPRH